MTYTPQQFARFRVVFGLYLVLYLATLLPYASELYGPDSIFAGDRGGFQFRSLFPNLLDTPFVAARATTFVALLGLLGAFVAAGTARRIASVLLWYGLTCLVNRNPGTMNPSHAFIGWLCLALALVPTGEPWSRTERRDDWRLSPVLYWGAWWVIAITYSLSGWVKLQSLGWMEGRAITLALDMPYARPGWVRDGIFWLPDLLQRALTWWVLMTELLFAPLALFPRGRQIAWGAAVLMHVGLLLSFRFWELSVGMLVFHLFLVDARWWGSRATDGHISGQSQVDFASGLTRRGLREKALTRACRSGKCGGDG